MGSQFKFTVYPQHMDIIEKCGIDRGVQNRSDNARYIIEQYQVLNPMRKLLDTWLNNPSPDIARQLEALRQQPA